jgi:hypothetical protein
MADSEGKIKGLGISRDQLKNYLKARIEQGDLRPLVVKEMYSREDDDYRTVTENSPRMLVTKIRMHIIQESMNLTRTKSLIQVFLEQHDLEMISLGRKGRLELLGALQMLSAEGEGDEKAVNLGGR